MKQNADAAETRAAGTAATADRTVPVLHFETIPHRPNLPITHLRDLPITHFRGYPVLERRIEIAGRAYTLLGPANYDALPDDPRVIARFERDEYMPYWADLWPGTLLLAEHVAGWPCLTGPC